MCQVLIQTCGLQGRIKERSLLSGNVQGNRGARWETLRQQTRITVSDLLAGEMRLENAVWLGL